MTDKSAIIFGATGAVGKPVVAELVASPYYASVHAFVRRPFKAQSAYKDEAKLVEHIVDFDKLTEGSAGAQEIKALGAEAVYITCGYLCAEVVVLVCSHPMYALLVQWAQRERWLDPLPSLSRSIVTTSWRQQKRL